MEVEEIKEEIGKIIEAHGTLDFDNTSPMEEALIELHRQIDWYPLENEWCLFHNKGRSITIAQFQEKDRNSYFDVEGNEWTDCLKYEEELPAFLKIGLKNA